MTEQRRRNSERAEEQMNPKSLPEELWQSMAMTRLSIPSCLRHGKKGLSWFGTLRVIRRCRQLPRLRFVSHCRHARKIAITHRSCRVLMVDAQCCWQDVPAVAVAGVTTLAMGRLQHMLQLFGARDPLPWMREQGWRAWLSNRPWIVRFVEQDKSACVAMISKPNGCPPKLS
eukprot:3400047-Karenia_brevis.AAC.1